MKRLKLMVSTIILLIMVVLSTSVVKAESKAEALNALGDVINSGLTFEKAIDSNSYEPNDSLKEVVKNYIYDNSEHAISKDEISVITFSTAFDGTSTLDLNKIYVRLSDVVNNGSERTFTVKYNNVEYNSEDANYVKNAIEAIDFYELIEYDYNISSSKTLFDELTAKINNLLNDSSITVSNLDWEHGTSLEFGGNYAYYQGWFNFIVSKNGVVYYKPIINAKGKYYVGVPANVTDKNEYAKEKINKFFKENEQVDVEIVSISYDEKNNKFIGKSSNEVTWTIDAKIEEVKEISKVDSKTDIKLVSDTSVIDENTVLVVSEITDELALNIIKESLKDTSTKYTLYDLSLLLNDVKVQPNGKLKISIPIPEDYDKSKLVVYRIKEDGTKDRLEVNVKDGYAEFETDHFTWYALAEENVVVEKKDNTVTSKNSQPATGVKDYIVFSSIISTISLVGMISLKKKYN